MAGALLQFEGGYLGIERCKDLDDQCQYLRAVIHHGGMGRTVSAPITIEEAELFAETILWQAALAREQK